MATAYGNGVPRHATQIYEALFTFTYFYIAILSMEKKVEVDWQHGRLFGIFLIWGFGSRFLLEFIKENQVAFEDGLALNMGQWLSIPFGIGRYLFHYSVCLRLRKGFKVLGHNPIHPRGDIWKSVLLINFEPFM